MEQIKKKVEEIFQAMGFKKVEIDVKKDNSLKDKELLVINTKLEDDDADYFLKEGAVGLSSFQHLVRVLVFKEALNPMFLIIDINGYRKKREEFLTDLALKTIEKIRKTKKSISLEPMSGYERRFIHMKLAEQPDIVTESIGEEPNRKIVVRLYP